MRHSENMGKRQAYKRDILRDYALASSELSEQLNRFDKSGVLSYSILRGLIGKAHSKGLLWQLKDTARHLLDSRDENSPAGKRLDWAIGFLFHESIIIVEASYQMQKYYPAAQDFIKEGAGNIFAGKLDMAQMQLGLRHLAGETQDRLYSSIRRIRHLLHATNMLMCAYLAGEAQNRPLARLIYDREELLKAVFNDLYNELLAAIYGPEKEKALTEAGWSLYESGHMARAERAAQKALAQKPGCAAARDLLDKISLVRQ